VSRRVSRLALEGGDADSSRPGRARGIGRQARRLLDNIVTTAGKSEERVGWRRGNQKEREREVHDRIGLVGKGRWWKVGLLVHFSHPLGTNGLKVLVPLLVLVFGSLGTKKGLKGED